MGRLSPYLTFMGNCEEAFEQYRSIFGGEYQHISRFREMPPQEDMAMPEEHLDRIMHISLPLNDGSILMGSDTGGEWASQINIGNNISISITADSKDDADRYFSGLSDGGAVTMPMNQTFWGDYFGMCVDRYGIPWMISFNENPPQG